MAVKSLRPEFAENQRMAQAFMSEAKIIALLQHPGSPVIHELVQDQRGLPQLVMPLFDGDLWSEKIGSQSRKERIAIVQRIAEVISYAHAHGVIHRDLKPSNIILGNYGEVLLIDWGLALHTSDRLALERQQHKIYGTPQYLDSEVARGNSIGELVDIYGLGALLFEAVTGNPPHPFDETARAVAHAKAGSVADHEDPAKDEVLAVALRCMKANPDERYQQVADLQADLEMASEHEEAQRLAALAEDADLLARSDDSCYDLYQMAVFRYREVLEMWPENMFIQDKLDTCLASYAKAASDRGDFDLALSLLDSNCSHHQHLIEKVKGSQRIRKAQDDELAKQQQLSADSALWTQRINDVLIGVIQEARPDRQGRDVSLIDAVEAAQEVIEDQFADDAQTRIDLRMALLDVFRQSKLQHQYDALREDIHADITKVGLGPKDPVFRRFTRYLINDHINAVRPRRALILAKDYADWVALYDSDDLVLVTDACFIYGECLIECGKSDEAISQFQDALTHFTEHAADDDQHIVHFKAELFAALKRGGYVQKAEQMIPEIDAGFRQFSKKLT